ncbi:hypothetical protein [Brevundimonas bacteroides]|uniref:hypothetical protein n=1 Tax=Brevundimonas bacteroides TaxID=74311 RepID=UPI0004982165|nr:hypothetical protein [Brevundimonas bacteroides]
MINQDKNSFQNLGTSAKGAFQVLSIGGVAFVQPLPSILSGAQVAALNSAARLAGIGRRAVAEAIVAHVQRELGVSGEMHVAGVELAATAVARAQREARRRQAGQARRKVVQANRDVAAPELSKPVRKALASVEEATVRLRAARVEAKRLSAAIAQLRKQGEEIPAQMLDDANRARTATWEALGLVRERSAEADRLRREQLEAAWSERAVVETATMAEQRGEQLGKVAAADLEGRVDGGEVYKPIRISSRDGLATLFETGKLSTSQYSALRSYRIAFEMAAADLRVANLNPLGVSPSRRFASGLAARSAAELQRAYVLARLRQIELAVAGKGPRELRVLRAVAGEGRTIRSLGGSGNAREADTKALIRAAEAALDVLSKPVHAGLKRSAAT